MFLLRNAPAFAELLRPTDTRTARLQRADVIATPIAALIFDVTRARSHQRAMHVREFETATRSKKCMFLRSRSPRSPWRDRRRRRVEVVRLRARRPATRPAPSVRFFSRTRDKKQANCTFTSKKGHIRNRRKPPTQPNVAQTTVPPFSEALFSVVYVRGWFEGRGGCQPGGRVGTHRRGVTPETSFSEASGGWEERLEFVNLLNARRWSSADARRWMEGDDRVEYVCVFLGDERRFGGVVRALAGEKSLGRCAGG